MWSFSFKFAFHRKLELYLYKGSEVTFDIPEKSYQKLQNHRNGIRWGGGGGGRGRLVGCSSGTCDNDLY